MRKHVWTRMRKKAIKKRISSKKVCANFRNTEKSLLFKNKSCYDTNAYEYSNIKKGDGKMTYTVFDIANWFLQKSPMDHKKVQKLCYYAQAWSLALNDKKLIAGDFEAWVHGPVSRSLWDALRGYGYSDIDSFALKQRAKALDEETDLFLERVWATYKDLNGFQLETLTHRESPWVTAREGLSSCEPSNRIIDNQLMKSYYRSIISADGVGE